MHIFKTKGLQKHTADYILFQCHMTSAWVSWMLTAVDYHIDHVLFCWFNAQRTILSVYKSCCCAARGKQGRLQIDRFNSQKIVFQNKCVCTICVLKSPVGQFTPRLVCSTWAFKSSTWVIHSILSSSHRERKRWENTWPEWIVYSWVFFFRKKYFIALWEVKKITCFPLMCFKAATWCHV